MVVEVDLTFYAGTKNEDEESSKEFGYFFTIDVTKFCPCIRFAAVRVREGDGRR